MNCKYCGNTLTDDAKFCPTCGKMVIDEQNITTEHVADEVVDPSVAAAKNYLAGQILSKAITSLVLSAVSITFSMFMFVIAGVMESVGVLVIGTFIGLALNIFGLGVKNKAKANASVFASKYGETTGKAKIGKILCIPATILNIILLVYHAMMFLPLLAAITQ